MTTKALPAQYDAVRRLSQDAVGDEWWALDKHLDPDSASYEGLEAIRDALHRVLDEGKTLSLQGRKGMLEAIMAGTWGAPAPAPDPPVDHLIPEADLAPIRKVLAESTEVAESLEQSAVDLDGLSDHDTAAVKTALEGLGYQPYQAKSETVTQPPIDFVIPDSQPEEETLATRKPLTLKPIEHGTARGYGAHRRRGEPPCDECKEGKRVEMREYNRSRYKTKRAAKKPDLKATTSPKPRDISRKPATPAPPKPNGSWVQTDEGRSIERDISRDNGANPIGRYLNLLLTLAESQDVPDPALLDKIDKLIGIAL